VGARLGCLGRIELEGAAQGAADELLARPQRVALLSYLLLGGGAARSREAVVDLFWPESSRERGRGSLRVALHALRKALGRDAIHSRGDALLIEPELLSCDAVDFEARFAGRQYDDALDLYAGDLLPGLTVRTAPRFESWLTARRAGLRRMASEAASAATERRKDRDRWSRGGRIAVLPFAIVGTEAMPNYLATGLAHEVIGSLARISGTLVVARTSTERYRSREGTPIRDIGRSLGVDALLDASVRTLGKRLAMIARLIDARTGSPIWAEVYEFEPHDLLPAKTRLVLDVVSALGVELSAREERLLAGGPTTSGRAYQLYLEGRALWTRRSGAAIEEAIHRFEAALHLDPTFALARAGLADAYLILYPATSVRAAEARVRARQAARAALDLDPELGEAYATLGLLRAVLDRDWSGAAADLRRARELSPGHATAHHWWGAMLSFGYRRFDEGEAALEIARQLDPYSPIIHNDIGLARLNRGDLDGARAGFAEALVLDPTFWRAQYDLGVTLFVAGDPEAGIGHLRSAWRQGAYGADPESPSARDHDEDDWRNTLARKLRELQAERRLEGTRLLEGALVSVLLGRRDEALDWVRIMFEHGPVALVMQYFPAFALLHDDPEFRSLLERAGIPAFQATALHPPCHRRVETRFTSR